MHKLLLPLICLVCGCARPVPLPPPPPTMVNTSEMTWILEKVMAKWEREEGRRLTLEHAQISYQGNYLNFRLEISSQEILELVEARFLFADFVEDLLRGINTDPIVAADLPAGPFTADNLSIDINFESYFGKYIDPFYIGYIEMRQGTVRYYAFDQKDRDRALWHARCEPYWKTRELAAIQRATRKEFDEQFPCQLPISIPEQFILPELGPECRHKIRF